ncbi:MAG TPA: heme-binding domain-containing protein [Flavipsychrobacter sp.]|nr:heme-binding domain-containing protein [Flavipsychrobacter sp.]
MLKKILIGLVTVLVVIQFIRPAKNQSDDHSKDISKVVTMPADVQTILKTACYDCHSNHTTYPWYDQIQPVRWWVEHHIREGKEHLNFSEFATYPKKKQTNKLDEIAETVEAGEMPLQSYTIMHKDARLTPRQKDILVSWATALVEESDEQNAE